MLVCAGVWLHGEAVSAGMVMAADMSHRLGWIDESIAKRATALLQRAKLPIAPPKVPHLPSPAPVSPWQCCHRVFCENLDAITALVFGWRR